MYNEHTGCSMSIVMDDIKTSWETKQWDCNVTDFLEAFYGLCVTQTFQPESVLAAMRDFAEERLEIIEKRDRESE